MSNLIDIFHYGDSQIELRVSGENAQRFAEFDAVFAKLEEDIKLAKPDVIVIPGDIYQYADTNGEEQEMFARHLHKIVDYTRRIVIIPGNHDIKQSNNTIIKDEEKTSLGDSIRSIVVAINNPKIVYYDKSGIFKDEVIGLSWVVWSQKNKHSKLQPKPEYNPWIENSIPEGPFIELFHDPVRNAKAFDGKPSKHFENYAITLNDFNANLILANDIHSPDIIWFGENNERCFTFSSSLIMRNFGEGDYYRNEIPYIKGNEKHGYNKVVFDLSTNEPVSVDFIPVSNPVSRQTMYLSKDFEYTEEKILLLTKSMKATSSMFIRIIASGNLAGFVETQSIFEKTFKEAFKESIVELYLECTSDIVLEQTVNQEAFEDLEQALDRNKIIDLAKSYIRKLVDSTSTIEKEDKEEAIQYISDLFVEEFNKHSFTQALNKIDFISFAGNNFMNFGKFNFEIKPAKINRIIGTNGIGKTKIWSFIAWMLVDSITSQQNAKEKTYNYALLFNDSSEEDVVSGEAKFYVNGELHNLTKTLSRSWKKNQKDIKHPEWWKLLSGTPTVEQTLLIHKTDGTIQELKNSEVTNYLSNLIGTFKDFEKSTFIDGVKLRELIKRDTTFVIQEILDAMGLTIIDSLLESYDSIKQSKLENLVKPENTAKEYAALIESVNINIQQSKTKQLTIDQDITDLQSTIALANKEVEEKRLEKFPVKSEDELHKELAFIAAENETNNKLVSTKQLEVDTFNVQKIDYGDEISKKQLEINTIQSTTLDKTTKLNAIKLEYESTKYIQKDLLTKESDKWHENAAKVRINIDEIHSKIQTINSVLTNNFKNYAAKVSDAINSIEKQVTAARQEKDSTIVKINAKKLECSSIQSEINSFASAKEILEKQLDEYISTGSICVSCGSELKGQQLIEYNEKVEKIKTNIQLLEKAKADKVKLFETTELDLAKLEKLLERHSNLYDKAVHELDEIKYFQKNSVLIAEEIVENKYVVAESFINIKSGYDKELQLLKESVNTLTDSIQSSKLQEYLVNFTKSSTYTTISETLKTLENKISVIEEELKPSNQQITDLTEEIENLTKSKNEQFIKEQNLETTKTEISDLKIKIATNEARKTTIEQTELDLAKKNVAIQNDIDKLLLNITTDQQTLLEFEKSKTSIERDQTEYAKQIEEYKRKIEQFKKYRVAEASLKLYKKLLSKDGLPKHIFSAIVPIINQLLNNHLSSVDFRLIFHPEYLDLRFIDIKRNTMRPIQFISGMQETIVGLSITALLIVLNQSTKYNLMFIDEVSGKVTDGSQLTYESKNYKNILRSFIHDLSEAINIYIIDPVLVYKNERLLEVQPGEDGSTIIEIQTVMK